LGARLNQGSAVDINMKMNGQFSPEALWEAILSRDAPRILETWHRLNREERTSLLAHLERMVSEDGWHPEQVISAQSALDAIRSQSAGDRNTPQ
jgi:hypothetical protein